MRRNDREIREMDEIFDVLQRCDTVRIGIQGNKYPYVVPVSFGAEWENEQIAVYFHCAKQGMKVDLIDHNPYVCVESDHFIRTEEIRNGITARYESVIGFGKCEILSGETEILHGLQVLIDHYGYDTQPLSACKNLENVLVGKIVLESVSGKEICRKTNKGKQRCCLSRAGVHAHFPAGSAFIPEYREYVLSSEIRM